MTAMKVMAQTHGKTAQKEYMADITRLSMLREDLKISVVDSTTEDNVTYDLEAMRTMMSDLTQGLLLMGNGYDVNQRDSAQQFIDDLGHDKGRTLRNAIIAFDTYVRENNVKIMAVFPSVYPLGIFLFMFQHNVSLSDTEVLVYSTAYYNKRISMNGADCYVKSPLGKTILLYDVSE